MNHKIILAVCVILLLSASFLEGSCENVGIQNITYNADADGKFFDISLKNYGNNLTTGRLEINFKCDKFNDTFVKNFEISPNKTKEFVNYYDFCECEVSAVMIVKNNVNKQTALTKNFIAITINFDELNLVVSGKIFPNLNTTFKILSDDVSAKEIYRGNVVNGKFSFELSDTGKFVLVVETKSCNASNTSKKFRTKYNTIITFKDVKEGEIREGKEFKILVTNQKGNPISGVSLFCNGIACGRTDGNGIFKFFANKTFILSVPETTSTWPAKKEIVVKEQQKIEIIIKKDEKEQENFSAGDSAIITVGANNSPLENVSVRIIKYGSEINKTGLNTTINDTYIILLNEEGIYEIFAEKKNFKPAKKVIAVRRNFDVNITAEEEKERVRIKVSDALTKEGISGAVVTIDYVTTENKTTKEIRQREKTDTDGELIFKIPPDKYCLCVEKENYNKFCTEPGPIRTLTLRLSKNYIFENHYVVFSDITITTFYTYRDIQVTVDKIFVKRERGNFSIYPTYAQSKLFLNETGKYEIYVTRTGYNDAVVTIFVEKTDIDVYLSVSKNLLTINPSKQIDEIKIRCNNAGNEEIELRNITYEKVEIDNISEKNCEIVLPEQYRAKFYVDNILVPTNSTDKFKWTIRKVYDYTWLYTAIIIIVLLSTLVIVQHRYKKKGAK
ncbi:MAG: hypothetical protein CVT88_00750 [Candidatus Altiarchaeales archaeon HGW-Altiarchaeales-1]|nr:MAG: hypothetical protein CVT88_00750 [Candidatus Altiarchaeales archaeon HGW-Altiarchaeales-1]